MVGEQDVVVTRFHGLSTRVEKSLSEYKRHKRDLIWYLRNRTRLKMFATEGIKEMDALFKAFLVSTAYQTVYEGDAAIKQAQQRRFELEERRRQFVADRERDHAELKEILRARLEARKRASQGYDGPRNDFQNAHSYSTATGADAGAPPSTMSNDSTIPVVEEPC
jgi:hypothetical protein